MLEVLIAATMLAALVCTSVVAMTQINRWATAARLRTLALAVAQQRIDTVQTVAWSSTRPGILAAGTTTENNLPLNGDTFNSATALRSAFTDLDVTVNATRVTQITDINPRTVRSVVTVSFTYRNRPYSVQLTSLRTVDSI